MTSSQPSTCTCSSSSTPLWSDVVTYGAVLASSFSSNIASCTSSSVVRLTSRPPLTQTIDVYRTVPVSAIAQTSTVIATPDPVGFLSTNRLNVETATLATGAIRLKSAVGTSTGVTVVGFC